MNSNLDEIDMDMIRNFREITNDSEFSDNHIAFMLRERNFDVNSLINSYFNQKESLLSCV